MKDKVTFLALHLGYGGIEKTICNQANMICDVVETEIISLYRTEDIVPYKLNKDVKVKYLTRIKPNREEFKKAVRSFNIFRIIKEGVKALTILYMKKKMIIDVIKSCDSKIIISTRVEFNELLNKYHNKDCVTICEEHSYHRNDQKYIDRVKNSLTNIDYFLLPSNYLYEDYKKILDGMSVKVKYIPLTFEKIYVQNNLKVKNIISVGRLSPEKGFSDLIDIMKLVVEKDKDIKLHICGDGEEKEKLLKKIDDYNLNSNVKILGFLNPDKLNEEYKSASLYVMTSFEESFGLVLIEAMSRGIPCFAFDSALGACEIINENNGLLVKDRNKEKMAEEIINYMNGPKKYDCYKGLDKYYEENVAKEWKKFVNNIIM